VRLSHPENVCGEGQESMLDGSKKEILPDKDGKKGKAVISD
jgi:hypothetical protein